MAAPLWSIVNLERNLPDGCVYTAHWAVSLEENGETAGAYGSVGFGAPEPTKFIPFDQLKEERVLDWVFDALGVDQMVSIQEGLHQKIQERLQPTHSSGVPW